jgi:hypothetical protein
MTDLRLELLAAVSIIGSGVTSVLSLVPDATPPLTVDHRIHDFRRLSQKDIRKAEFQLKNTSCFEIAVTDIRAECSCTVSSIGTRTLSPGSETVLVATWNVGSARGDTATRIMMTYAVKGENQGDCATIGKLV